MKIEHSSRYLPYGVKISNGGIPRLLTGIKIQKDGSLCINYESIIYSALGRYKLILRPLSDLTEDYVSQFILDKLSKCSSKDIKQCLSYNEIDYLLKHHFDIYGLIEKGEAIDINTL